MIGNKYNRCLHLFKALAHWLIRHRLDDLLRIILSIYPLLIASLNTGHSLVKASLRRCSDLQRSG